ncbi:SRPBCC domain-containing protein [Hyphomicrobium sp.]|uniref:SRPBCC family protein n=1 Tax=Hyphomicrobium sp. TaxID=82 RepID=UPI002E36D618|nr:SRPBCC domain-containing protein [Hyphomicrobium sp.]HEX2842689.1 SRPBCC domain-containing protein [Hyphomicrobium sp.]
MSRKPPNSVVSTREFTASAKEVFEAWTNPEIMRHWLAPGENVVSEIEADARIGGALLIRSRSPDGAIHTIRGVYRELDPPQRIAMTWVYSGPFALICAVETLIEIDIENVGRDRTAMTFTQSRFTTEDVAKAYQGDWPSCFEKLQSILGLPGRRH